MHERPASRPAGHRYPGPLNAGLSGTGLVADDLYLMAHDDRSGKPYLQPQALGIGLAGALLAELMLAELDRPAARQHGRVRLGRGAGTR